MKTLQEIKDEVAIEHGYDSFEQLDDQNTFSYDHETPLIIDEIAKCYAIQSLTKAIERIYNVSSREELVDIIVNIINELK